MLRMGNRITFDEISQQTCSIYRVTLCSFQNEVQYNTCASYDLYGFGCSPASLFQNIPLFPLSNCFDYGCKGNILYKYSHTD